MAPRPRDPNQLAKLVVDIATGEASDSISQSKRTPQEKRGRAGGLKGGNARASKLAPAKRQAIAKNAAKARWTDPKGPAF